MFTLESFTSFLGWCLLINVILLMIATVGVIFKNKFMLSFHSSLLGVSETSMSDMYVQYLSLYKVMVLVFNLAPYIALRVLM